LPQTRFNVSVNARGAACNQLGWHQEQDNGQCVDKISNNNGEYRLNPSILYLLYKTLFYFGGLGRPPAKSRKATKQFS